MANDDKQKLEMEIAIKDGFSTALKELGKQLDAANRKAMEMGVGPTGAFQKFKRENDGLSESAKRTNAQLAVTGSILTGIGRTLTVGGGIAYGIYEVGKALEGMAVSSIRMRNFATDTGFATKTVKELEQAGQRMGLTLAESSKAIATFGEKMNQWRTYRDSSEFAQALRKAPGGEELLARMKPFRDAGDNKGALEEFAKTFGQSDARGKQALSDMSGLDKSYLEGIEKALRRNIKQVELNKELLEEFHNKWVDWETNWGNTITRVKNFGMQQYKDAEEHFADPLGRNKPQTDKPAGKSWGEGLALPTPYTVPNFKDRFGDWPKDKATHPGITDFGGMRRSGSEDGVNLLTDIRDSLQRMETGTSIGGGSSSGGSGGSGVEPYGTGARGGALKAGLGGFRAGGVGTRADRNNNPGNIEYGDFAKKMGATGSDGRFAIFPDRETGFKASETLLGGKGYQGKTLAEIGDRWAEKDKGWAKNVSKATGIPLDAVPTPEQRSAIARTGIPRAEGSKYGAAGEGGDNAIPSSILAEAKKAALSGGEGAVKDYIRSKGYNVNSAWCGDFAAAVVKGAGGTPPKNYSVASNWRNHGQPVEGDPQPGDIAIKKNNRRGGGYVPTGAVGSHVNFVKDYDPETGKFTGIGGNQSRMTTSFPRSQYDFRRGDETTAARERVDKSASGRGGDMWGKGAVKVDFLNVPNGVKTSAEFNGPMFRDVAINRTKQATRDWEP
jgi:uncharacterized protein (TIGR02594 family)